MVKEGDDEYQLQSQGQLQQEGLAGFSNSFVLSVFAIRLWQGFTLQGTQLLCLWQEKGENILFSQKQRLYIVVGNLAIM